jgi:hypothetical protein
VVLGVSANGQDVSELGMIPVPLGACPSTEKVEMSTIGQSTTNRGDFEVDQSILNWG